MKKIKSGSIVVNPTDLLQGGNQDSIEDRSAYIRSDDEIEWTGTQLNFTSDLILEIVNSSDASVKQFTVSSAQSPVALINGESAYISVDRATSGAATIIKSSVTPVPAHSNSDKDIFILFRRVDTGGGAKLLHVPLHKQVILEGQTKVLGSGAGSANLPALSANERGSFIVQNDADNGYEVLDQGSTGQLLQSNGSDALPTWTEQALVLGTINIGIQAATTSESNDSIKITSADGSALSSSNIGYVVMSGATSGQIAKLSITSDVIIDLTGTPWDFGGNGDLTDAVLYLYAINDAGTLKWGVSRHEYLTSIDGANDETIQTSVNTKDKVLVNSLLTGDSHALYVGYFKANFDDTGGVSEDLFTIQTGLNDIGVGIKPAVDPTKPLSYIRVKGWASDDATTTVRFESITDQDGDDITISSVGPSGVADTFTINREGWYRIELHIDPSTSDHTGVTRNSTGTSTGVQNLPDEQAIIRITSSGAHPDLSSREMHLDAGDILRMQTNGQGLADGHTWMSIARMR